MNDTGRAAFHARASCVRVTPLSRPMPALNLAIRAPGQSSAPASAWAEAFAGEAKDGRYHALVPGTVKGDFDCRVLEVRDAAGALRVLQPVFLTHQDLLVGVPEVFRRAAARIRRNFPRFLVQRMLMVGCAAGEGHAGLLGDQAEAARLLFAAADELGRAEKCALVTFKDFPKSERAELDAPARAAGYRRIPSFPGTVIADLGQYRDFEDYLDRNLSKATRKDLRRKFRAADAASPALELEVATNVDAVADEICALYRQVFAKSEFRFEELTPEYFRALGREMPETARHFLWRCGGRLVAASSTLVHAGRLYDNYLGLDYEHAHDRHLYFVTLRDVFNWAVRNGVQAYYSTPLNYDPKLRLRFRLEPLDLYVKSLNRAWNPIFRRILPWLEPTRYDRTLRRFENHGDMA